MQSIATDVARSVVYLSVYPCVGQTCKLYKKAELIEMPFGA